MIKTLKELEQEKMENEMFERFKNDPKIQKIIVLATTHSTSERGLARTIQNFDRLIQVNIGFALKYAPLNNLLKTTNMTIQLGLVRGSVTTLGDALGPFSEAVRVRKLKDDKLNKYATRVCSALAASEGVTKHTVDQCETILRKLRGARAKAIPKTAAPEDAKHISVSQESFDSRVQHAQDLLAFITGVTAYATDVVDLTIVGITAFVNALKANNDAVTAVTPAVTNARDNRDSLINTPVTGMIDVALASKKYTYSVFDGPKSSQGKQVSILAFTRKPKKK